MQFYFIRHGQSENNVLMDQLAYDLDNKFDHQEYAHKRQADAELSILGNQQAQKLGGFVFEKVLAEQIGLNEADFNRDEFQFTHLYVSPMIRTLDTALPIAEALDLDPIIWEDIHEQGGIWTQTEENDERLPQPGIDASTLKKQYPRFVIPASFNESGWWNLPYEEPEKCFERSGKVLEKLLEMHGDTDDRVAFVSHSIFFNCIMYQIFGFSPENIEYYFLVNNASITRIDIHENLKRLVYQNRVDYLPSQMIT